MIKEPIDLRSMAIKMNQDKYKSVNDVEKDLLLMCKNAKQFNEPASIIYKVNLIHLMYSLVFFTDCEIQTEFLGCRRYSQIRENSKS